MDRTRKLKRIAAGVAGGLGVFGLALFAWIWFAPCWLGGCAPVAELAEFQAEGSQLLDVNGDPFGTLATVNRRVVSIDSLPVHIPQAFVAVEDQRFYDHGGVDFVRLFGAVLSNVKAGGVAEGGSTITQQLARNLFPEWLPYTERSLTRKLKEARVARQIERSFSKEKILELYINHIYLGEGAYGIDAASQRYFGKPAAEMDLAEAALIGGLPKAPSQLNPVVNRARARERRDLVLGQMLEAGFITKPDADAARASPIKLAEGGGEESRQRGSYFVERVRQEMEDVVGNRFYTAGLKVYTTLDPVAQRASEEELIRQLERIESGGFGTYRHATYAGSKGKAEETGQTPYVQGAVVLMDARTGEVRAMVGGRDFQDSKFNRAMQAERQPGSAFKPFVYAEALERYGHPAQVMEDAPIRMVMDDGQVWEPKNYTGEYAGPMTLREALTRSKNTVTVRLAQELGTGSIIERARQMGITGQIPNTPAMALGTASIRPIELVRAYAAFANGGTLVEPHFIRRVVDRNGNVLYEAAATTERVMDSEVAFVLTSMLQDVVTRGTGTPARIGGYTGPAAGKTGTTNDAADVWFVGYTPELVAGVWMGLDEPKTIVRGASGGTLAAPVWGRIMGRVYRGKGNPANWSPPAGISTAEVEMGTGMVVGAGCPARGPTYTEYFIRGAPSGTCDQSALYPPIAMDDTLWIDEEWGAGMQTDTLAGDLGASGIEWPELEALRERMRTGEPEPLPPDPLPGDPARPPVAQPTQPAQPEPQRPTPPRPPVLGDPVRPDTTRPPPPDTSGVGERVPGTSEGGPSYGRAGVVPIRSVVRAASDDRRLTPYTGRPE